MKWISELTNTKGTTDALLIGSGASLDYLPYDHISKTFSKWAYVIVVNDMAFDENIQYDFAISHHTIHKLPEDYLQKRQQYIFENPFKHVASQYDCNKPQLGETKFEGDFYMYKGLDDTITTQVHVKPIIEPMNDYIFVGGSILFDAIGLGLHLGIKNFYLLGFDGGDFNGKGNYSKYLQYYGESYSHPAIGHSVRTMNSFKSLQEWIRPRGVNFINLSARYGSSMNTYTDWNSMDYRIVE
jgi:hypothetical protein